MVGFVAARGLCLPLGLVLPPGFVLPLRLELALRLGLPLNRHPRLASGGCVRLLRRVGQLRRLGLARLGSPAALVHAAILGLAVRGKSSVILRGGPPRAGEQCHGHEPGPE